VSVFRGLRDVSVCAGGNDSHVYDLKLCSLTRTKITQTEVNGKIGLIFITEIKKKSFSLDDVHPVLDLSYRLLGYSKTILKSVEE
jgi:hypothetical protein